MSNNKQEEGCLMEFFYGIGLVLLIIGVVLSLTGVGAIIGLPVAGVGYMFSYLAKGVVKLGKGINKLDKDSVAKATMFTKDDKVETNKEVSIGSFCLGLLYFCIITVAVIAAFMGGIVLITYLISVIF
jgi:hypothetical protein